MGTDISAELGIESQEAGWDVRYAALQAVVDRSVSMGLADSVSITEIRTDGLITRLSSDPHAGEIDELQYELNEGPCFDAAVDKPEDVVTSGDTAHDVRWPRWGPAAAAEGCAAVISIQLSTVGRKPIGAVNMFRRAPHEYATADLDAATVVATHASIALAQGRHDEDLWRAIDARHLIGVAQGVIMQRFEIGLDESFRFLRRVSQHTNTKVHVIAEDIVRTRAIPGIDVGEKLP